MSTNENKNGQQSQTKQTPEQLQKNKDSTSQINYINPNQYSNQQSSYTNYLNNSNTSQKIADLNSNKELSSLLQNQINFTSYASSNNYQYNPISTPNSNWQNYLQNANKNKNFSSNSLYYAYNPDNMQNTSKTRNYLYQPVYSDLINKNYSTPNTPSAGSTVKLDFTKGIDISNFNLVSSANQNNLTNTNSNNYSNLAALLEKKEKEVKEMQEKLDLLVKEDQFNKKLVKKFTEENSKLLIEINQFKQYKLTEAANKSLNLLINDTADKEKSKEHEKEIESLKYEINSKAKENETLNKTVIELTEKIINFEDNNKAENLSQGDLLKTAPYIDLSLKLEVLIEERNNLKALTSELQTLYGEMIEEVRENKLKLSEASELQKELENLKKEFSKISHEKEAFEAKANESQIALDHAKSKNMIIKTEKESLVETINRLNKEIDIFKSEANKEKITETDNINKNNKENKFVNTTLINDLPELFKLELEEKEKAFQILQCSLEEREKIIEQLKTENNKIISRNKSSHNELINLIEDLKFKIINLEKEIQVKNSFISIHTSEFSLKKIETENLSLENKQLKDRIRLIPELKREMDNLKAQIKKQLEHEDELRESINSKESRIVKLEKKISALENDLEAKDSQLQVATEECETTKLYEKKRDIIHSTLLDIRDLKEKIAKDKNNLTIAFNVNNAHNIFTENSGDFSSDNINYNNKNNETVAVYPAFGANLNRLFKSEDYQKDFFTSSNNNHIQFDNVSKNNFDKQNNIEEARLRTEALESYRKINEEDISFFQNTLKSFDLSLLTEFEFLLNSKNWTFLSQWLGFLSKKTCSRSNLSIAKASNVCNSKDLKLKLLFKATRDGFAHFDFKEKCAGKTDTLLIAITNYDKIIGGFTPLPWENTDEHVYLRDDSERSFMFSLDKKQKLRLISPEHAICLAPDSGPIFGGGSDLEIVDNCNVNYNKFYRVGHSYEYADTPESFFGSAKYLIKDYEIYEVSDD